LCVLEGEAGLSLVAASPRLLEFSSGVQAIPDEGFAMFASYRQPIPPPSEVVASARPDALRPLASPLTVLYLQRGCEHLHLLGPRAVAGFLIDLTGRIGGWDATLSLLGEYRQRLTPEMLRLTGGDRFPPRPLHLAPRS
jgi:hypothetical protein